MTHSVLLPWGRGKWGHHKVSSQNKSGNTHKALSRLSLQPQHCRSDRVQQVFATPGTCFSVSIRHTRLSTNWYDLICVIIRRSEQRLYYKEWQTLLSVGGSNTHRTLTQKSNACVTRETKSQHWVILSRQSLVPWVRSYDYCQPRSFPTLTK